MRLVVSRTFTVAGFAADANPNITAPTAGTTYVVQERSISGNYSPGLGMVAVFAKTSPPPTFEDDTLTAAVAFTFWFRDASSKTWMRMTPDAATHRLLKTSADLRGPTEVFVQVTAINSNPASATSFTVSVTEA